MLRGQSFVAFVVPLRGDIGAACRQGVLPAHPLELREDFWLVTAGVDVLGVFEAKHALQHGDAPVKVPPLVVLGVIADRVTFQTVGVGFPDADKAHPSLPQRGTFLFVVASCGLAVVEDSVILDRRVQRGHVGIDLPHCAVDLWFPLVDCPGVDVPPQVIDDCLFGDGGAGALLTFGAAGSLVCPEIHRGAPLVAFFAAPPDLPDAAFAHLTGCQCAVAVIIPFLCDVRVQRRKVVESGENPLAGAIGAPIAFVAPGIDGRLPFVSPVTSPPDLPGRPGDDILRRQPVVLRRVPLTRKLRVRRRQIIVFGEQLLVGAVGTSVALRP